MSPVARTCVPPQSSVLNAPSPIDTTRTLSPYFSPNSAIAPDAIASCVFRTLVVTVSFLSTDSLTSARPAALPRGVSAEKWTKSNRRRSGATSEPACLTCGPSTLRNAACNR